MRLDVGIGQIGIEIGNGIAKAEALDIGAGTTDMQLVILNLTLVYLMEMETHKLNVILLGKAPNTGDLVLRMIMKIMNTEMKSTETGQWRTDKNITMKRGRVKNKRSWSPMMIKMTRMFTRIEKESGFIQTARGQTS